MTTTERLATATAASTQGGTGLVVMVGLCAVAIVAFVGVSLAQMVGVL